ncbi:hypothetical protein ACHAW5_007944 [Stephanodiscus triporus]|uniref:Uncharacterized protein n=1 Tax=Stephanodiscus triporus TaxID=2934178 RepID=A0ABD3NE87_9STRA
MDLRNNFDSAQEDNDEVWAKKKKIKTTMGAAAVFAGGEGGTGDVEETEFEERGEGFGDDDDDDDDSKDEDEEALFPTAFCLVNECDDSSDSFGMHARYPRTLIELKVLRIMQAIAEKRDWQRKLRDDPQIFARWVHESHAHESLVRYAVDEMLCRDMDIRAKDPTPRSLADLCIDVVRRSLPDLEGILPPGLPQKLIDRISNKESLGIKFMGIEGVYARDDISGDLHDKLCAGVERLQAAGPLDWHPGSNEQVLNLVHPSLFPLISGVSRRVATTRVPWLELMDGGGGGEVVTFVVPIDRDKENACASYSFSKKYQWLPAEFIVANDNTVTINSYINNLHPSVHADLYHTIGDVFQECVPLLECCLTDLRQYPLAKRHEDSPMNYETAYDAWKNLPRKHQGDKQVVCITYEDCDDDSILTDSYDACNKWCRNYVRPISCEMGAYKRRETPPHVKLQGRTLKVIVKLASIVLTPEKPAYNGGAWHVEGMSNEAIVATAIYYFSQENVTQSSLAFREAVFQVEEDEDVEHNDHEGLELVYGLSYRLHQELGAINTNCGRILAFPNVFQHRVQPFTLVDKERSGHRNILAFFLCDPAAKIESSATILPLRRDWWSMEHSCIPQHATTMTMEEAKLHREELMTERKFFIKENNEQLFEREVNLCEH